MSNLTFDHRLLKEHTPEPLEGHAVVVFERVGEAGDEFHSVLHPGSAPVRPGLPLPFRKRPEYFAYAVDTSPERHLDFNESMRLADHVSEFRVVFNLAYAVSDVRALARGRNGDPLRKVRDQVRVVIRREVEQLPWQAVWEAFPQHAHAIVDECLEELRDFAGAYGIAIRSLRLTVRLPEAIEDIHQGERLTVVKRESEQRVSNHGRMLDLQNAELAQTARLVEGNGRLEAALMETTIRAAEQGDLGTMDDMIRRVRTLQPGGGVGPSGGTARWRSGDGTAAEALPPGAFNPGRTLPASTGPAGGGLGGVLCAVVAATDPVRVRAQKQALRSALLHLVAEMLVDDVGDGPAAAGHADRARKAIHRLDPAPAGADLDALNELADPERLRSRLDG
jgi:hypothetical protein